MTALMKRSPKSFSEGCPNKGVPKDARDAESFAFGVIATAPDSFACKGAMVPEGVFVRLFRVECVSDLRYRLPEETLTAKGVNHKEFVDSLPDEELQSLTDEYDGPIQLGNLIDVVWVTDFDRVEPLLDDLAGLLDRLGWLVADSDTGRTVDVTSPPELKGAVYALLDLILYSSDGISPAFLPPAVRAAMGYDQTADRIPAWEQILKNHPPVAAYAFSALLSIIPRSPRIEKYLQLLWEKQLRQKWAVDTAFLMRRVLRKQGAGVIGRVVRWLDEQPYANDAVAELNRREWSRNWLMEFPADSEEESDRRSSFQADTPGNPDLIWSGLPDYRERCIVTYDRERHPRVVSEEELSKAIPEPILRLAYVLSGAQFAVTRSRVEEKSRSMLDEAKQLVEKHFPDLFESDAAVKAVARMEKRADMHPLVDSMNMISSISPIFTWYGSPPKLLPGVRIGFMNRESRMLLDSLFDWDDLAYVLTALTDILAGLLERSKLLAEADQLDLSDAPRIAERLAELTASLDKIKQLLPIYGIDLEAAKDDEFGEEASTG